MKAYHIKYKDDEVNVMQKDPMQAIDYFARLHHITIDDYAEVEIEKI